LHPVQRKGSEAQDLGQAVGVPAEVGQGAGDIEVGVVRRQGLDARGDALGEVEKPLEHPQSVAGGQVEVDVQDAPLLVRGAHPALPGLV
jgi:hypothetical protein